MGDRNNNTCVYRVCKSKGFESKIIFTHYGYFSWAMILSHYNSYGPSNCLYSSLILFQIRPKIPLKLTIIMAIIVYSVHLINFDDELKPKVLQQWWVFNRFYRTTTSIDDFSYIFLICLLMIFIPSIQILAYRLRGAMCDRKITLV